MYLKLFCSFFKISFLKSITYRFDFIMSLFEGLTMLAINMLFFYVTAIVTGNENNPYNFLLATVYQVYIGIFYGLFIDNITGLKFYINRGDLDWMLMKPVSSQFYISMRFINFGHFISAIFSIPVMFIVLDKYNMGISKIGLLISILYLIIGLIDAYTLLITTTSLAIVFTSSGNVSGLILPLISLGKYPRKMFSETISRAIIILLPAILLCNFACEAIMGVWNNLEIIVNVVIAAFNLIIAKKVFGFACNHYKSSGS